jgi:5S rRNA maturation endonuclease (ribonuclease M5)
MLTPEERLEQLEAVFLELEDASETMPIIVEGKKDAEALARLGITKNIVTLSKGISIFTFSEGISRRSKKAVILTDWDRKGGQLARMLKEALMNNGVGVDDRIRAQLAILSKKEVKDIESMPRFVTHLRQLAGIGLRRPAQPKLGKRI